MTKCVLITGATDGIGLETAKRLVTDGHRVLVHGRNPEKVSRSESLLNGLVPGALVESVVADLSRLQDVTALADAVLERQHPPQVLINNAGVYGAPNPKTADGLDVRFAVNTIAPYLLARRLSAQLGSSGRVINVSSAAQSPVSLDALAGREELSDGEAYAQSKLAITMWTHALAKASPSGPVIVAVNPGSLLASKMVKSAFGIAGNDLSIGADILSRAATEAEFAEASGRYFDNDSGRFAPPHPDGTDQAKCRAIVEAIETILREVG
ncbi:MAG: SDR family NAD(P)-dependent oxidoreductase [Pseudomonadota bacterium]